IVASANRLIGGFSTAIFRYTDGAIHLAAFTPTDPAGDAVLQSSFPVPSDKFPPYHLVQDGAPAELPDTELEPAARDIARARGYRSMLFAPLMNEGTAIGIITVTRRTTGSFGEAHIQLLQMFAAQSVIAIENVRLFNETKEALEHQTATAEVLGVISSSMADPKPVFEHIVDSIVRLFKCKQIGIFVTPGDGLLHLAAGRGANMEFVSSVYPLPVDQTAAPFVLGARQQVYYEDCLNGTNVPPSLRRAAEVIGNFSVLLSPMLWEDRGVGMMTITREPNTPFNDKERALLKTFADQAVIAIENARLFNETKEALEQQKASADILRVVSNSVADAQPVFDEILRSIEHLFGGDDRFIYLAGADGLLHIGAAHGANAERVRALYPVPLEGTASEVAFRERRLIRYADVFNDPEVPSALREVARRIGTNYSMALAPLLLEDRAIGSIFVGRTSMKPFSEKECSLLRSFADQAVIAIENARLFNEVKQRTEDLSESLQQQTATADVLRVIASSPADVEPALQAIVESACALCDAYDANVLLKIGDDLHFSAHHGPIPTGQSARPINRQWVTGRSVMDKVPVQVSDFQAPEAAEFPEGQRQSREQGHRCTLSVPLLRDAEAIGAIALRRLEPMPFTGKQIALLQTFADQAVIAIENVRLFNETKEALEQQKASADILRAISSSVADAQPAFDKILDSCKHLFGSDETAVLLVDDEDVVTLGAYVGKQRDAVAATFPAPADKSPAGHAIRERRVVHYTDATNDAQLTRAVRHVAQVAGYEAMAYAPMMWNERGIGAIGVSRLKGAFRDKELALLQTFADQAVIAIQNARLFNETKEALERQTATADILKVIAGSPSDVRPVFEAIVSSSKRLLSGFSAAVFRFIDGIAYLEAITPTTPAADEIMRNSFPRPVADFQSFAMVQDGRIVQVSDTDALSDDIRDIARGRGFRSMLLAPLMSSGTPIGLVSVTRVQPGTFAVHHEQLLRTFADQAVIAIENVRLFNEVQLRTEDLSESLQQQTAVGDVLKTISRSTFDLQPVLDTLVNTAALLCNAEMAFIMRREGDEYRAGAAVGYSRDFIEFIETHPLKADRGSITGRAVLERRTIQILDVATDPEYMLHEATTLGRQHTALCVPLLREDEPIGTIVLSRQRVEAFTQKQIELVTTFADQAVIAIENVRLFDEVRQRTEDLSESLQQQTATADVLKVISRSAFDLDSVLATLVESAATLCEAERGMIFLRRENLYRMASNYGFSPELEAFARDHPFSVDGASTTARAAASGVAVQAVDILADETQGELARQYQKLGGHRTNLGVPLRSKGETIGIFTLTRQVVRPFSEKQIELVSTFADQAVIAIENVRLFDEVEAKTRDLSEALTYQTGSANILKVIASSPTDVGPVFNAIVESACELCEAYDAVLRLKQGEDLCFSAHQGPIMTFRENRPISRNWTAGRAVIEKRPIHVHDLLASEGEEFPEAREMRRHQGHRTVMSVPLLREGESIGAITLRRLEVNPFSDKQITLLQTFADQAVIAIGNVRLFEEVQAKTRDLTESLQQQTATADVLKVISRSAFDLQTVLDTLTESAARLCGADMAAIARDTPDGYYHATSYNFSVDWIRVTDRMRIPVDRGSVIGRALLAGTAVQIPDVLADPEYAYPDMQKAAGYRTLLGVPMLRGKEPIGVLFLGNKTVEPFTDKQTELVSTFADQAVIAIENVRLFDEVQAKTRDLSEALTYQTGSANILKVIASSPTEVGPVLNAIVESACELCEAYDAVVLLKDGDTLRYSAHHGPIGINIESWPINRGYPSGRAFLERRPVHVQDILSDEGDEFPDTRKLSGLTGTTGVRTVLSVPLLRENESIGTILLRRTEVQSFSEKQIALLQTFADQAVIAIGNVRLFDEVQAKTRDLSEALTYQTGSGNILRVIASSPTDVKPALTAIVESACELCEADDALATLRDGDELVFQAQHGSIPVVWQRQPIDREGAAGLAVINRAPVHVHDLLGPEGDQFPRAREFARTTNVRTVLCVPLLREGESIGAIVLRRTEVRPFSDKQISLLQTFADQAVIAIGNVRLFEEVQAKTRDLEESLQQQTATADVLKVISASPGELEPVFQSMLENAVRLCEAKFAMLFLYQAHDNEYRAVGKWNLPPAWGEFLEKNALRADPRVPLGQVLMTKQPVQVPDVREHQAYIDHYPGMVAVAELGGARTLLQVPLLRENELVGAFGIYRQEVRVFTDKQIELVRNFAAQAVIA
ncbi:MAG: GAF domain-containing protein, partial [Bradyrhizobium sp.]